MSVYLGSKLVSPQGGFTLAGVVDLLYPIGSIYLSVNNVNPGTLFGGTWVAFGSGKTLVGVDTNDADFDTVEETGGEKTHILTAAEIPAHNHEFTAVGITPKNSTTAGSYKMTGRWNDISNDGTTNYDDYGMGTYTPATVGNEQPHNNMPPYITCYMWKRTA